MNKRIKNKAKKKKYEEPRINSVRLQPLEPNLLVQINGCSPLAAAVSASPATSGGSAY